jgi:hypothetical protein
VKDYLVAERPQAGAAPEMEHINPVEQLEADKVMFVEL